METPPPLCSAKGWLFSHRCKPLVLLLPPPHPMCRQDLGTLCGVRDRQVALGHEAGLGCLPEPTRLLSNASGGWSGGSGLSERDKPDKPSPRFAGP